MLIEDQPIAVIGAGAWGTALALLLAENGNPVRLWSHEASHRQAMKDERRNTLFLPAFPFPSNIFVCETLSSALDGVRDILLAVPSHAFRSTLESLFSLIKSPRIAWGTKGLDPKSHCLLHEVVAEIYSKETPVAVLSGPSFAQEVAEKKPTAINLASNDFKFTENLLKRLQTSYFYVRHHSDLIGIQLCGILKNILAIAVGIADGLGHGANTRALLISYGLMEIEHFCDAMKAERRTAMSLAGVGDLVLTCTDDQSRNRRLGRAVAQGKSVHTVEVQMGCTVEGVQGIQQVRILMKRRGFVLRIVEQLYRVFFQSLSPEQAISDYLHEMSRVY